jgi:hypothetical protein
VRPFLSYVNEEPWSDASRGSLQLCGSRTALKVNVPACQVL